MKNKTEKMEKLKNLKVDRKLKKAFSAILVTFTVAVVIVFAGVMMINANLKRFYNESYANMQKQLEIRRDVQLVGKNVLWAITSTGNQQEKMNDVVTYAERVEKNVLALEESFSDKEKTAKLDAALKELKAERVKVIDLAEAGETESALTLFNGTYNDATENIQNVLLEIGDMADTQAATAYTRATTLVSMVVVLLVIVGVISVLMCIMWEKRITELLLTPIRELQSAAQKLKGGELDVAITYQSQDELGDLAQNFREACDEMRIVIKDCGELLSGMADGNFDVHTKAEESYVGDFRLLIDSLRKLNRQLNGALRKIDEATEHVMTGSGQLAGNAQSLAEGATEQSGAVQELMANVTNVASIAEESAESSVVAADRAKESAENAERSKEEMNALTGAMERITATSKEIENIIAAIEDIASQTNLLALNASIEAARAGEAGKGFAVVADQIGKLAADSAESAVSTRALISKSLEEVEAGNQIVVETMQTIASVLEGMDQFAGMVSGVADASKKQAAMLKQVESGIGQISAVVESNSAAAEETSAVSQELSAQAQTLEAMVAQFEFREE